MYTQLSPPQTHVFISARRIEEKRVQDVEDVIIFQMTFPYRNLRKIGAIIV